MSHQRPTTHEAKGHLYYAPIEPGPTDWDGLDPYQAIVPLILEADDNYVEAEGVEINGEQWDIRLNYSKSGIAPRPQDPIDAETLWEFDITVDGRGRRGGSYQLSPRYGQMCTPDGDSITTPFHHVAEEGLSVQFQMSNMALEEIHSLFPRVMAELFAAADRRLYDGYFEQAVGGRIEEIERYVRITRNMAQKVIQQGGVFHKLALHMSSVDGIAGEYKFDNSEAMGFLHQFRYHDDGASELVPTHQHGKQLKTYLPEHPDAFDEDDPLYHHKVGALYRKSLNSHQSVRWENREELLEELDESLLNVLSWADVPVSPGGTTYVSDDHFQAGAERSETVPLYDDPTPQLEAENENLLLRTLRDLSSRTDADIEILETVATDGGQHVTEVAERTGYSLSTIYRAIDRMSDALETSNGHVRFVTTKIAEEIRAIADSISEFIESGAKRASKLLDRELRGAASSAFDQWLAQYNAEFDAPDSGDRPVVRIDTVLSWLKSTPQPHLQDVLDELVTAWANDGNDPADIRGAWVEAELANGDCFRGVVAAHL